jgi:hypothetical protein
VKRSEPLRSDPQATSAWQQRSRERALERARGREGMASAALRAATAPGDFRDADGEVLPAKPLLPGLSTLKRTKRKKQIVVPKGVRQSALRRSEGLCIVCLYDALRRGQMRQTACRATQLHHVLPQRTWPEFAKCVEILVGICPACHQNHESAFRRIPWAALPQCAVDFARRHRLDWFIERTYPA